MWTGWNILTTRDLLRFWLRWCGVVWFALIWFGFGWLGSILLGQIWLGLVWFGWDSFSNVHNSDGTQKQKNKKTKKHDDMLSCCATNKLNLRTSTICLLQFNCCLSSKTGIPAGGLWRPQLLPAGNSSRDCAPPLSVSRSHNTGSRCWAPEPEFS